MTTVAAAPFPQLGLTLLYDAEDGQADGFRRWLAEQVVMVPIRYVAAGSAQARALVPDLPVALRGEPIVVVGDDGAVWSGDRAWFMCLWATLDQRPLVLRLTTPAALPHARSLAVRVAGLDPLVAAGH